jgi:hypothetical protein
MLRGYLVGPGIILLAISLFFIFNTIKYIKSKLFKKSYYVLIILVIFFIFGYIYCLINSIFKEFSLSYSCIFLSSILLFGSVFVILISVFNYCLIKELNIHNEKISKSNMILKNLIIKLKKNKSKIEKFDKDLKLKNSNLIKTLEEFYTLRLSMHNQELKENNNIKKKIEDLKK